MSRMKIMLFVLLTVCLCGYMQSAWAQAAPSPITPAAASPTTQTAPPTAQATPPSTEEVPPPTMEGATPPIMPHIAETPLPPAITLPTAGAACPSDIPNRPLTAGEAALIALHYQPTVTAAAANIAAAQAVVQQARAGLLPGVLVNAGYNNNAVVPASGAVSTPTGYTAGATLHQLIYDFNHTRDLVRQTEAQLRSSRAGMSKTQSDLVYSVKQAFYTYSQDLNLIGVNESNLKNSGDHLALAKAQLNAGTGLPVDVVRAETAVQDAILNLNLAQNTADVAKVMLATLMGIDPRTPIQVAAGDEPVADMSDFNALLQTAIRPRPDIAVAQANLQAALIDIQAAKTSNAPVVTGTVTGSAHGAAVETNQGDVLLGVSVAWDAYDSGFTAGRVNQAKANSVASQAQLLATEQSVTSDVSQAYVNEKTAEERVVTAKAEVINAQEALRLAQGRYSAGLGVFLDVLDAQ